MCATCPTQLILFGLMALTISGEEYKIIKLKIFSTFPRWKYFIKHFALTLCLRSSFTSIQSIIKHDLQEPFTN
jgi:hypothetical protein